MDSGQRGATGGRIAAGVLGVLFLIAILPAAFLAFTTIFFFDAPGSTESALTVMLAAGFWAAPIVCGVAASLAFRAASSFSSRRLWIALAPVGALLAYLAIAYVAFDSVCAGRFAC